ncbi:MAG: 3-oxoacyl-ACP reductase [Myxococcales bacterium]|jgi:3-oxoacyl-[acyl-carrier protein] reductase
MTDMLLELSQNRVARDLVARAKLPIPLPERLERSAGPMRERELEDMRIVVAGEGALGSALSRVLTRSGASPLITNAALEDAFAGPGEAYGRIAHRVQQDDAESSERIGAIVLDATGLQRAEDLSLLHRTFHPWLRALGHHGRCLVLGRPPQDAGSATEAAARAALDGFNRSLAKEIGGGGSTANLLYVAEGAEDRLAAPVRFFLSKASAFVTGQNLHVDSRAQYTGDDPWAQPLANKVALVTGAARGIGASVAETLAAEGAHVVCLDRPEDDEAVSGVARAIGGSTLLCNVLDHDAPTRIASELQNRYGGVDIVVHNAGVTRDRTLKRMDEGRWQQTLGINLEAILHINDALLDGTLRDGGRIVSLSSIAGIAGNNGQTNYAASKAGVIGMTRHLAGELAPRGITVNAVAPGFIETRMTAAVPAVVRQAGRRLSALGQGGLPEDVARTITFLSTPGAAGITGNVLRICGGGLIGA